MVCSEKLRRWSSSSIIFRRWVTGTPPVTHTYIKAIKQPTLHYLTRSVRRRAAASKRDFRKLAPLLQSLRVESQRRQQMNDVISTLKSRRSELALELGRIDKAIAILSNGSGGGTGKATRARATGKPMSAAM